MIILIDDKWHIAGDGETLCGLKYAEQRLTRNNFDTDCEECKKEMVKIENNAKRVDNFLKELAQLTQKYGVSIGGCGCCGSPWLNDDEARIGHYTIDGYSEHLKYIVDDDGKKA